MYSLTNFPHPCSLHTLGLQKVKVVGSKDDLFGEETGKARKKTEEGWNVYTEVREGYSFLFLSHTFCCAADRMT